MRPRAQVLLIAQNRLREKEFLQQPGFRSRRFGGSRTALS